MKKENLKIVFFGTPEFAVCSLRRLLDEGFNVCAVVTMPDKQAGRGHHTIQSDVKRFAAERELRVLQPEKLKDEAFVGELRAINADLFVVIAFRMLPEVVWSMPRLGTFNLHASLLPKYRGAAPINWAVINGETETGVTTFFLKHEIDTGDIIRQERVAIGIKDNAGTVHDKLMETGAAMVVDTVAGIAAGTTRTTPQDDLTENIPACPAPKIFKETCHIDWNRPAIAVYNHIRGLSPYPAAWSSIEKDGKDLQIKIFETELPDSGKRVLNPGRVETNGGRMFVDCADGRLEVLSLQLSGKKRMGVAEFLRGFNLDGTTLR